MTARQSFFEAYNVPCPVCGTTMRVRTSRQISDIVREMYVECCQGHDLLSMKFLLAIVADLHQGSYDHGLNIPHSLRKQALAPVSKAQRNQLSLPGCEKAPEPSKAMAAYEVPCPLCQKAVPLTHGVQRDAVTREYFAICLNPFCSGRFRVECSAVLIIHGDAPDLDLPRFAQRRQALSLPVPDPRQLQLAGLDPIPEPLCGAPPGEPRLNTG